MLGSIYSYERFEGICGYSLLSLSGGIFVRRQSPPIKFGPSNTKQLECKRKAPFSDFITRIKFEKRTIMY